MKYFITTLQIIKKRYMHGLYQKSKYEREILINPRLKSFWGTATDVNVYEKVTCGNSVKGICEKAERYLHL